jgi:hypothetical protein
VPPQRRRHLVLSRQRCRQRIELEVAELDEVRADPSTVTDLRSQRIVELRRADQPFGHQQFPDLQD